MWQNRCYSNGIPDEVPELLSRTGRAPSWKKIAMCILNNDLKLRGLGFTEVGYNKELVKSVEGMYKRHESDQLEFDLT